jgi:hypothetical protein
MLRQFMLLAAGLVALSLTACGGTAPTLTFQQQVAIACGAANGEIAILKGDGVFTGGAANTLTNTVQPAVDKVCAAGASVTTPDLKALVNTTLLMVKAFVDVSSLSTDKKNAANAAIDSVVLTFNIAVSMASTQAATAASTPLSGARLQ